MENGSSLIIGLENIGVAVGRSRWTVRRWIYHESFPACRLPDGVYATSSTLIDGWVSARAAADMERKKNEPATQV